MMSAHKTSSPYDANPLLTAILSVHRLDTLC